MYGLPLFGAPAGFFKTDGLFKTDIASKQKRTMVKRGMLEIDVAVVSAKVKLR